MRNLHMHNCPGHDEPGLPGSIKRESEPQASLASTYTPGESSSVNVSAPHSFSSISKWTTMVRNLSSGIEYVLKQDANLNEMENLLRAWRKSLSMRDTRHATSINTEGFLFLPSILKLSEETLFNHPLFGDGVKKPIRVHLKLREARFIQEIPTYPLFIQPGFSALAHSGRDPGPPSQEVFDLCQTEFLNGLLEVKKTHRSLERHLNAIREHQGKLKINHTPPSVQNDNKTLKQRSALCRIINWFSKSIAPRPAISAVA